MSVAGIHSTNLSQLANVQSNFQKVRGEFQQLAQDLTSGNLTQAQTDFVSLSQSVASSQLANTGPLTQVLNSLGQALQSGNLSAAQQAFASLPQNIVGPSAVAQHHHAHHGSSQGNSFSQALTQLGQALQSGDLSAAQQAFAAVQQSWQQFGSASTLMASGSSGGVAQTGSSLNVTA